MDLNRLTQRAKSVLTSLPKKKRISVANIVTSIKIAKGMGSYIIQNLRTLNASSGIKTVDPKDLIKEAYYQAIKFDHSYVGTEHILLALLKITKSHDFNRVKTELTKLNIFPNTLISIERGKKFPILDTFGVSITSQVLRSLDQKIINRDVYSSLVSTLLLKDSPNVLLVGEPGVGKKSLIELLAKNILSLNIPASLAGYQVIEFDLLSFMSSVFAKSGFDLGINSLVDELKSYGRVILTIKNFDNLFYATSAGLAVPMFYSMFVSNLQEAKVRIVACMSNSLYEKVTGDNDHIFNGFTVIEVDEPSRRDSVSMLRASADNFENFHGIKISQEVINYVYEQVLDVDSISLKMPEKGIVLLDHSCTELLIRKNRIPQNYRKLIDTSFDMLVDLDADISMGKYKEALKRREKIRSLEKKLENKEEKMFMRDKILVLTKRDVDRAVKSITNQPLTSEKVNLKTLSSLSEKIKKRIIGQEKAVDAVARCLVRAKLGLRSKKRPMGNMLFLGPTGVGKTELAKVLSDEFYGSNSLIRLDMSDFAEKHNVARLVGAPPGYVGYGEGGELTTKIEATPESVVLFDEIEKAHPDVLNILLQIMEEGELTDAKGQTYDFSKSVVILTSNLGTEILHNAGIGFENSEISDIKVEKSLMNNLKKILKAELLNRFDEIIVFARLKEKDQYRVLELLINDVKKSLLSQNIKLSVNEKVKEFLLKKGYSQEYGARALRRTLERELLDKIAEYLLKDKHRPLALITAVVEDSIEITVSKR